jgi:hypothetical protein
LSGESLVNDFIVLRGGLSWKCEDSRRYPFQLQEAARVKGDFHAIGNVTVCIPGHYSSGGPKPADTIDLVLPAGTYELVITALELAGVSLHLLAMSLNPS